MEEEEITPGEETQPVETSTESTTKPVEEKPRHALMIRMQELYPDVEDDDELMGKANDHISELESFRETERLRNSRLIELARKNPTLIKVMQMMDEGASFEEAVARNVDLSAVPVEGEPEYEKWAEASKARQSDFENSVAFEAKLAENKARSLQNLRDFAAENNMSEEQAMQFIEQHVSPLLDKIATLDFSPDFLKAVHRMANIDQEVEQARADGVIEGKNENIQETVMNDPPSGDGLPKGAGATSTPPAPVKKTSYIDQLKNE